MRAVLKTFFPSVILRQIQKARVAFLRARFKNLSNQVVFSKIYRERLWGGSTDTTESFYSGAGSHDEQVVSVYISAISQFLRSFPRKPTVADLGCGDFFIGAQLRQLCSGYVACDVVPELISFNQEKYRSLGVDFCVLDLASDPLPKADVAFLRQVLQHLSNTDIKRIVEKVQEKYKYLVLTEHLPEGDFTPNSEKPAGPDIRLFSASGVVLTEPPFNLRFVRETKLCEVSSFGGVIRTLVYEFR